MAGLLVAAALAWAGLARADAPPEREVAVAGVIDAWVAMWNSYDLTQVDELFVTDDSVTYYSSERPGLIRGGPALRAHHQGFGFVPGGKSAVSRLWLEDRTTRWRGDVALVLATWRFRRGPDAPVQHGPVTFVLAPAAGRYRIAHAHFANH